MAAKPNFDVPDSPPPLIPYDPSSDYTDTDEANGSGSTRGRRARESQTHASLADGVLIRHIDPNRTDIAVHGEKNALESASQSEAEEEVEEEEENDEEEDDYSKNDNENAADDDWEDDFPMIHSDLDMDEETSLIALQRLPR